MRSRRGIVCSSFRDTRDWIQVAEDFGALSAYLTDAVSYEDKIGSIPLQRNGSYLVPTTTTGPNERSSHVFNNDYCLASGLRSSGGNGNNFALEFWFSVSENSNGLLVDTSSGGFSQYITNGDIMIDATAISGYDNGYWHHLVRTTDGSTENVYIDGELENTRSVSFTKSASIPMYIGGFSTSPSNSLISGLNAGAISSVAIYNQFLSLNQVKVLKNAMGPTPVTYTETWFENVDLLVGEGYGQSREIDLTDLMSGVSGFENIRGVYAIGLLVECTDVGAASYPMIDISMNNLSEDTGSVADWLQGPGATVPVFNISTGYAQIGATSYLSGPGLQVADGPQPFINFFPGGGNSWLATEATMTLYVNSSGSPLSAINITDIVVMWY